MVDPCEELCVASGPIGALALLQPDLAFRPAKRLDHGGWARWRESAGHQREI